MIAHSHAGFSAKASGFASNGYGAHSPGGFKLPAVMLTEVVFTGLFVFVIASTSRKSMSPGLTGVTVGLMLTVIHLITIPVDNTSVNPARSLATAIFQHGWALGQVWVFIVFPLIGGAGRRPGVEGPRTGRRRLSRAAAAPSYSSDARSRPSASRRSSWSCIQTVWYESMRGEVSHSASPLSIRRRACAQTGAVAAEPDHEPAQGRDDRADPVVDRVDAVDDRPVVGRVAVVVGDASGPDLPVVAHADQLAVEPEESLVGTLYRRFELASRRRRVPTWCAPRVRSG